MNFDKIKQEISIVSYLKSIGCKPQFENGCTARYIAPYRADSNPSLSINISSNLFFDHGTGIGGNVIQLAALINQCNDREAAEILSEQKDSFSFHCIPVFKEEFRNTIEIKKIKSLENIALLQYLSARKINIQIAQQYCKEVYYQVRGKPYFAIAFENRSNGLELRSKYFKGATSKDISILSNASNSLLVFEGFIDMLSFYTYSNEFILSYDAIVLNSLSCIDKAKPLFSSYQEIHLYLDNDNAGESLTKQLLLEFSQAVDCSDLYKGYKDFNDYLIIAKK